MTFHVVGEYRGAQYEDEIRTLETRHDAGPIRRKEAGEQRVPLGKTVARRHGTYPDRSSMQLSERDGLIPRIVSRHRGADHNHGSLRAAQRIGGAREQHRIPGNRAAHQTAGHGHARAIPVVDGNRHQRGAAGRLHRYVVGARHGRGNVRRARGFDAPFHVGLGQLRGLFGKQKGLEGQYGARLLPRRNQQRRLILVRREDAAQRMADADGRMQIDEGGVVSCRSIAIGHGDHHRLLQSQHVAEIVRKIAKHRQFGGTGIAENRGQSELAQQRIGCLANGDRAAHKRIATLPKCAALSRWR